ncbi:MAG: integrase arm-type DNA-binding domain-containing protein [Gammaproteobacteria bacterium]|nr:integrase arm-type DNA-binding domain-containing protein [Gammaproteobacteria bacterium]
MPRLCRNALSAAMVRNAAPGSYVDGNGLMLRVTKRGTRQWIQRLTIHGRRVDLGLGSAELVRLSDARRTAADNRAIARTGGDPRRARVPTFAKAEEGCFKEKLETWRTKSPARSWRMAVDRYVLPKLGGMPVDQVGSAAVYEILRPIALSGKHAVVKTAGAAITSVLEWARINEYRSEGSPVEIVRRSLPKRAAGPKHHDALHWSEVGAALVKIDATNCASSTKRAIRFTALTAARQIEVRRATWEQFDLEAAVWTKPAESMKTGKAHRVPLSTQALDLLREARADVCGGGLAFPGSRPGAMVGDKVMTQALRQAGIAASGHGFRSSFKDWAREHDVDELLSEFALAHVEGSATVAAYARDDLLEKRRPVMQGWADCMRG